MTASPTPGLAALIGHTGFVGSALRRQARFDAFYRSTDIDEIGGREFDLLVCAGAPAEKWKANAQPESDLANLSRLMRALETVHAREVILISTVDVYPVPHGVDEDTHLDPEATQPYGRHRLLLERHVAERFPDVCVVRLPGLYGEGLKKNVIFDLLHENMLDRINPQAIFQFYGLDQLWADIAAARAAKLDLVNFATEPVSVADIAARAFERALPERDDLPRPRYDVRTRHAARLGGRGAYLQDREAVLAGIARYVAGVRSASPVAARSS